MYAHCPEFFLRTRLNLTVCHHILSTTSFFFTNSLLFTALLYKDISSSLQMSAPTLPTPNNHISSKYSSSHFSNRVFLLSRFHLGEDGIKQDHNKMTIYFLAAATSAALRSRFCATTSAATEFRTLLASLSDNRSDVLPSPTTA